MLDPNKTRAHAKQKFWQIIFPIILAGLIALSVLLFLLLSKGQSGENIAVLSQVATVVLISLVLILAVFALAFLVALIIGLIYITRWVPQASQGLLNYLQTASGYIRRAADLSIEPLLRLNANLSRFAQIGSSFKNRFVVKENQHER